MTAYPALAAWRAELARGERTPTTFDDLWRAACAEQSAIDYEAMGLPSIAEGFRADARRIAQRAKQLTAQESALPAHWAATPDPGGWR